MLPKSFIALIKDSDGRKPEILLFTAHGSDGRSFHTIRGSKGGEEKFERAGDRNRAPKRKRHRYVRSDRFRGLVAVFNYNILIAFGTTIKLIRLTKMCLKETYSKDSIGKNVSDVFPL